MEESGSYGAGLSRFLLDQGLAVIEVPAQSQGRSWSPRPSPIVGKGRPSSAMICTLERRSPRSLSHRFCCRRPDTIRRPRARRAALRGSACYLAGAIVGNMPKTLFGRHQLRHRRVRNPKIVRGSFPSGHACAQVAFVFEAAQEAPKAFLPFATMAMLAHLSLTKNGKHFVSETLVGDTMGRLIAAYAAKRWPTEFTTKAGLFAERLSIRSAISPDAIRSR